MLPEKRTEEKHVEEKGFSSRFIEPFSSRRMGFVLKDFPSFSHYSVF